MSLLSSLFPFLLRFHVPVFSFGHVVIFRFFCFLPLFSFLSLPYWLAYLNFFSLLFLSVLSFFWLAFLPSFWHTGHPWQTSTRGCSCLCHCDNIFSLCAVTMNWMNLTPLQDSMTAGLFVNPINVNSYNEISYSFLVSHFTLLIEMKWNSVSDYNICIT